VKRILASLVETLGARGGMVVSRDGLPIASVVGKDAQVDRLAAMAPRSCPT
jgi:predicted regulator of Ras-like GTPase activity (Roadblock/LC7/MglB family)